MSNIFSRMLCDAETVYESTRDIIIERVHRSKAVDALLKECGMCNDADVDAKITHYITNDDDYGHNHEAVASVSLSCCGLLHDDLGRVWRSLGTPCELTVLE